MDIQDFLDGKSFDAYTFFGAHPIFGGTVFRTYAPNAWKVGVCGDFSDWDIIEMNKVHDCGIFEVVISNAAPGMKYLYRVYDRKGNMHQHCDPFGAGMEYRPFYSSIIRDLDNNIFQDENWIHWRSDRKNQALNIYEVHLGSWKKDHAGNVSYSYIADELIPYMKQCGYTYVEFLPLTEYPCDESWGYQTSCFFSPTSRYGTAEELMQMINRFHMSGIGVILDLVPGHFAVDDYSLRDYDGTCLYEYPYEDVKYNEWGSLSFNLGRNEVRSFLFSAANYWIEKFHFDGLRIDSVSNILYWKGQRDCGVNQMGVEFLRLMNQGMKERHPDILLAAEDSTEFPHVTAPVCEGGLGFDYKWDMGWMHDTLEYFQMDPYLRSPNANKLTFSMWYFRSERFLLPLSHDEVVHGKATILQKMNGDTPNKFPQAKAFYTYMYMHPGKKLNFMGNEIGQLREWSEKAELDWKLLGQPEHLCFHNYIKTLNHTYLTHAPLHFDYDDSNFEWADLNSTGRAIFAIRRKSKQEEILSVMHFDCDPSAPYELDLPPCGDIRLLVHSAHTSFGGNVSDPNSTYEVVTEIRTIEEEKDVSDDGSAADTPSRPETIHRQYETRKLRIQMNPYDCLIFLLTH